MREKEYELLKGRSALTRKLDEWTDRFADNMKSPEFRNILLREMTKESSYKKSIGKILIISVKKYVDYSNKYYNEYKDLKNNENKT